MEKSIPGAREEKGRRGGLSTDYADYADVRKEMRRVEEI